MQYITVEIGTSTEARLWAMKRHLDVLIRNTRTFITEEGGIQLQFENTSLFNFDETCPNFPGIKIFEGPPTAEIEHPCSTKNILPLQNLHIEHFFNEEWPKRLWFE